VGEFLAEIDSQQPGRAERLKRVLLRKSSREQEFDVARLWFHDGRPVFAFAGIDSISAAEPWEGAEICVPAEERVQPEPGEYLHSDLIGCVVEERGRALGTIESIDEPGGPPMLVLKRPEGGELLIPFAKAYLREVDVGTKRITVKLPEGLTEL
jgi:16S rRNA processing protein RimM